MVKNKIKCKRLCDKLHVLSIMVISTLLFCLPAYSKQHHLKNKLSKNNIIFTLIKVEHYKSGKSNWHFKIKNLSKKSLELNSFPEVDKNNPFCPFYWNIDYFKNNRWHEIDNYPSDGFSYPYHMKPGSTIEFSINIDGFMDNMKTGTLLRIRINNIKSSPFILK